MAVSVAAVSIDLFGTLVTVDRPNNPATAIAEELDSVGILCPDNWQEVYTTAHLPVEDGAELSLPRHVTAALTSASDTRTEPAAIRDDVDQAVREAFDCPVETRPGARTAVRALAKEQPVGVLSNCSVPGLVEQTLDRSRIDRSHFDTVVSSVECGWRKPDNRAFEGIATEFGVETKTLAHVGDDNATDGGVRDVGGAFIHTETADIEEIPAVIADTQRETQEAHE